jgi:ribosome maturation protein Sdo1
MIRTHLIPETNNVTVNIPDNYIGRKVEVIVFADEDMQNESPSQQGSGNIKKFKGALKLSDGQYKDIQQYLKEIRSEWDREF